MYKILEKLNLIKQLEKEIKTAKTFLQSGKSIPQTMPKKKKHEYLKVYE